MCRLQPEGKKFQSYSTMVNMKKKEKVERLKIIPENKKKIESKRVVCVSENSMPRFQVSS